MIFVPSWVLVVVITVKDPVADSEVSVSSSAGSDVFVAAPSFLVGSDLDSELDVVLVAIVFDVCSLSSCRFTTPALAS